MGNNSAKSADFSNPEECKCRKTEFKYKWCPCGRSKPSDEPPTKIRFWMDKEKIQNGIPYNVFEIPEHAKTEKERDPKYQNFVRELHEYSKQINSDIKKE